MKFLDRVEPYLVSEDYYVQKFVLNILMDIHQFVPAEWTERLLKDALDSKQKELMILTNMDKFSFNLGAINLLIKGLEKADKQHQLLYLQLLDNIEPENALEHQMKLDPYIQKKQWDFYRFLQEATEEEIWEEYGSVLGKLEEQYNHNLYVRAKQLVKVLVKNGWVDEAEIEQNVKEQLDEDYFGFDGIMSVYLIGLMKLTKFIPLLTSLLDRDEDILLEETTDALISFQSDEVVELVYPYAKNDASSIFAIAILSGIKTDLSTKKLRELFFEVEYEDEVDLVFEALCHQLSTDALPEIEEYMNNEPESFMIEIEETVYGFYKVLGKEHRDLLKWKRVAEERDNNDQNNLFYSTPIRIEQKIGRNDPCPCESGKKYKKCCGA